MNINYVRLDELPPFDRWGEAVDPLARGDFFTTTGEVLLPEVDFSASIADRLDVWIEADWTFPPAVRRDRVGRRGRARAPGDHPVVPDPGLRRRRVRARHRRRGLGVARVAVWDVAGNGAFVNPTWRSDYPLASGMVSICDTRYEYSCLPSH